MSRYVIKNHAGHFAQIIDDEHLRWQRNPTIATLMGPDTVAWAMKILMKIDSADYDVLIVERVA